MLNFEICTDENNDLFWWEMGILTVKLSKQQGLKHLIESYRVQHEAEVHPSD